MTPDTESAMHTVAVCTDALLEFCKTKGIILTISTVPQKPLAMGNYVMQADIRLTREKREE